MFFNPEKVDKQALKDRLGIDLDDLSASIILQSWFNENMVN